jgi:hypothetical protein
LRGPGAKPVERSREISGDGWGFAGFDVAAGHHVDELTLAQNGNRG